MRPPKVEKLWRRGDVPGLLRALGYGLDGDEAEVHAGAPIRAEVVQALARAESDGVSEAIVHALADPNPTVRDVAIEALYGRGSRRALEPLCDAVTGWTAPELAPGRAGALTVLEAMRDPKVSPRVATDLISRPDPPDEGDREVVTRLANSAPDALTRTVGHLLSLVGDGDRDRGSRAGMILVWLSPASVEPLIEALDEDSTREGAAFALGYIHDKRAVEPLCSLMLGSPDPAVRRVAAWALGEIRDLMAVEALVLASNDADYEVRTEAGRAFDAFGNVGLAMAVSALMPTPEQPIPADPSSATLADGAPADSVATTVKEPAALPPRNSDPYEPPSSVLGLLRGLRRRHSR